MGADVLTARQLNRATLARQHLLRHTDQPITAVVDHLVGLQAQVPLDPYLGLWSRCEGFDPHDLGHLLETRQLVRTVVMRGTIHLVTADDCLALRPLMQPVLDRELLAHREHAPVLRGFDLAPVLAFARTLLAEQPLTGPQLRGALSSRFPDTDAAALAYACRNHLTLVQVPPRGVWGKRGAVTVTTAEAWLGRPLDTRVTIDAVVLRYLAAFGPASVADISSWCRLTGMGEVVERLRPQLRTFRSEGGRELVDLPDAPRPAEDTPAPPRMLPEYDNVLLSHADRSRFAPDEVRARLGDGERAVHGSVLFDPFGLATWRLDRDAASGSARLSIDHPGRVPARTASALRAEGRRMLRFLAADAPNHEVDLQSIG